MSMKNSNDNTGNRSRDLPTCSAVPQPTAPPRTPSDNTVQTLSSYVTVTTACPVKKTNPLTLRWKIIDVYSVKAKRNMEISY